MLETSFSELLGASVAIQLAAMPGVATSYLVSALVVGAEYALRERAI
jgi:hypothetical protein